MAQLTINALFGDKGIFTIEELKQAQASRIKVISIIDVDGEGWHVDANIYSANGKVWRKVTLVPDYLSEDFHKHGEGKVYRVARYDVPKRMWDENGVIYSDDALITIEVPPFKG